MKQLSIALLLIVYSVQLLAQTASTPPPMLVASYSKSAAYIIDENGKVIWECGVPGPCQDAWLLADGNVLLSGGNKVKVVRPDKSSVWEYTSPAGVPVEIHNCQPLPDGGILFGEGGTGRIIELDSTGKIAREIKLQLKGGPHGEFRQVRKTPKGSYLFCNKDPQILFEIDADGKTLRQITASDMAKQDVKWGALHSVDLLSNGNLLVGGGYESPVAELDPAGKVVWRLTNQDVPELGFTYSAGLVRLPNGNTVVAAYHSKFKIFEVTRNKEIVWKYDNPEIGNPTHVKLLKPGDLDRFRKTPEMKPAQRPRELAPYTHKWPPADQVMDRNSLPDPSDKDEADAVLRRTGALIEHLKTLPHCPKLKKEEARLAELKALAGHVEVNSLKRAELLEEACKLRRTVAFSNPLLDFDRILFIKRHFCPEPETGGNHMCDQFFGFNAIRGGGLFVLEDPFSDNPRVRNVLENSVCENGRYQGRVLSGKDGFLSPELSFDAKDVLFACTEIPDDQRRYQGQHYTNNTYKIFRVRLDGTGLTQLTDGMWNDFDPCYLPSGRIIFISERRGGFGRCHGRPVPSFTLHSMNADGSDIVELSPHETNEWQPSVNNWGMVVYTRWDYVDRGFNQAHHAWITSPDGRDPRAVHGNFSPNQGARPHLEISLRAVPGTQKYMGTAACHHGQAYGSIILIDPRVPDDNAMAPVKRLTPDQLFPEAEIGTHGPPANYATPHPLSEHFFLCVYDKDSRSNAGANNNYGIYLVDAFGNKELLYRDAAISCLDPIPVKARAVPPVIPHMTAVGRPLKPGTKFVGPDPATIPAFGTVGLINVYDSIYPMTNLPKIVALRIIQLLPKTTPIANNPQVGFGDQKSARMVLGTVPVEEDGSAFFRMPVNKPVYFQALDAEGVAVQSMRSATYVHPGETLTCIGCHDSRSAAYKAGSASPAAFKRQASEIKPDVEGSRPFSFPILVQPVLEKNCVECHRKSQAEGKKTPDLTRRGSGSNKWFASYDSLRNFAFFWDNAVFDTTPDSKPGEIGARRSRLYQMLTKGHHDLKMSREDMYRLTLWLDCNSDFYGAYERLEEQRQGNVVWPSLE